MRKTTPKKEKNQPKNHFWDNERGDMELKGRYPQKAHLGPVLNIHIKFQVPGSILRGVMRETNPKNEKNEKNQPINHFWGNEVVKWG